MTAQRSSASRGSGASAIFSDWDILWINGQGIGSGNDRRSFFRSNGTTPFSRRRAGRRWTETAMACSCRRALSASLSEIGFRLCFPLDRLPGSSWRNPRHFRHEEFRCREHTALPRVSICGDGPETPSLSGAHPGTSPRHGSIRIPNDDDPTSRSGSEARHREEKCTISNPGRDWAPFPPGDQAGQGPSVHLRDGLSVDSNHSHASAGIGNRGRSGCASQAPRHPRPSRSRPRAHRWFDPACAWNRSRRSGTEQDATRRRDRHLRGNAQDNRAGFT